MGLMSSRHTEDDQGLKGAAAVAHEAGVSVFTVSRVFNNASSVSTGTRRRILEVARRMGYRADAAGRLLVGTSCSRVGFVRPVNIILGQIYQEMLAGLEIELGKHAVSMVLSGGPDETNFEAWLDQVILSAGCEGIFLLLNSYDEAVLRHLSQLDIPVVLLYHAPPTAAELGLSSVCYDTGGGIAQSVRHLVEIGHRDIAYFGIPEVLQEHVLRENAFRAALADAGLPVREEWVIQYQREINLPPGAAAFDQVFSRGGQRPTAIVCGSDAVALGALSGARRWNRAVPGDVSVTGFDDTFWLDYYTPAVTSVRQSGLSLGSSASLLMLSLLSQKDAAQQVLLPTQLIVRESTAPPRSGPT